MDVVDWPIRRKKSTSSDDDGRLGECISWSGIMASCDVREWLSSCPPSRPSVTDWTPSSEAAPVRIYSKLC